jgi:hypothetical protein
MFSNRLAVALVGGACVLAAGAGAFVATRQSAPVSATVASSGAASEPAALPVEETEAVMQPDPAPSTARLVPQEPPAATSPAVRPAPRAPRTQRRDVRPRETAAPAPPRQAPRAEIPVKRPLPPVDEPVELPQDRAEAPAAARAVEPAAPVAPQRIYDELTIPADSVVGLQIDSTISSESARVEDQVEARVTRDVFAEGRIAVPEGTRVLGTVTLVDQGGKVKVRARLGVRFHTLVLDNGTTLPIQSDTIYREGESPGKASAAKIGGGAIGGAIIGGILGGKKGAVIGGSVGAAGGTAATMAGSRREATLPAGSTVTVRVLSPVTVTAAR